MSTKKSILYQEHVKMPNDTIGVNCFFYDCANAPSNILFPLHWHEHLEIIFVQEGWLDIEIENEPQRFFAGETAVVNPRCLHAGTQFDRNTKLYCLMADMDLFRSRFVDTSEERYINPLVEGKISFRSKIAGDDEVNELIRSCFRTFSEEKSAYQLLLKSYLFGLLFRLFRDYVQENVNDPRKRFVPVARERVNTILSYVDEHYAEKIKLEDLVELVHINKYYICKIFQQCTGKTLLNYVNIVRVQKAVEKLITTNDPVTDIAFSVGFQDINYFSRIFKRVMNVSPTDIRRKYKQTE